MAERQRTLARNNYLANPNLCVECNSIINLPEHIAVTEIRSKKFCNNSCAANFNNRKRRGNHQPQVSVRKQAGRSCLACQNLTRHKSSVCHNCRPKNLILVPDKTTKGELRHRSPTYQTARSRIRMGAINCYARSDQPLICICGYDKYIEICHKIAVADFDQDTPLYVINAIDNLIALCPNCHWEFDNGILDPSTGVRANIFKPGSLDLRKRRQRYVNLGFILDSGT